MAITPLNEAIFRAELTKTEIARRLGVDQSVVSRWASGERIPKVHDAQALARILNTTVAALWPEPTDASLERAA